VTLQHIDAWVHHFFFFSFMGWDEAVSSWYISHYLAFCISPGCVRLVRSSRWSENWQGKPKYSEKTWPSATLSTATPTWPDLESNLGCHGGEPVATRLSYGTALRVHSLVLIVTPVSPQCQLTYRVVVYIRFFCNLISSEYRSIFSARFSVNDLGNLTMINIWLDVFG
jgi:hypothetical protein